VLSDLLMPRATFGNRIYPAFVCPRAPAVRLGTWRSRARARSLHVLREATAFLRATPREECMRGVRGPGAAARARSARAKARAPGGVPSTISAAHTGAAKSDPDSEGLEGELSDVAAAMGLPPAELECMNLDAFRTFLLEVLADDELSVD
jgi:hypothetical protein